MQERAAPDLVDARVFVVSFRSKGLSPHVCFPFPFRTTHHMSCLVLEHSTLTAKDESKVDRFWYSRQHFRLTCCWVMPCSR